MLGLNISIKISPSLEFQFMKNISTRHTTLCPNSEAEMPGALVFGVIAGTVTEPRIAYLEQPVSITDELLAKASPVKAHEVFRIASTCIEKSCQHFDGKDCRLARRFAAKLPPVVEELPDCSIRRDCRWWKQEGLAACVRCPQAIRYTYNDSELIEEVATPEVIS
jgi:hypothetical protein